MFQATATIIAGSERRDEMIRTICSIVEPTKSEPGCLACGCYEDARDPNKLLFLERWRSREDFERHVRTDRFRVILSVVDMSAEKPQLSFDAIGRSDGLDYIDRVLNSPRTGLGFTE